MTREIHGVGIGLRLDYAEELLRSTRTIDFLEVVPENWVRFGGKRRRLLAAAAERWPAVPHSVSLSIGGPDPLDAPLLEAVAGLCRQLQAPFYSDHLCYSTVNGGQLHDLLPLPFTHEAAAHVVGRVAEVQARLEVPLVLENATFYAHMPGAEMDEAAFLCTVLEAADCGLLLDVNNVYVNSRNHGFDPVAFIDRLPLQRVRQLHLAGHTIEDEAIIDTHIGPIIEPVWELYRYTLARAGRMIPTLIEWDQEIPPVDQVIDEADRARQHAARALAREDS
jgi:uncharacterized protein (UPF0276 family)